jgi:hypothetical protein
MFRLSVKELLIRVISSITDLLGTILNPHEAGFTPTCSPGVFQSPAAAAASRVVPTYQLNGMVAAPGGIAVKAAAGVGLPVRIDINGSGDSTVGINRVFDGCGSGNGRAAANIRPAGNLIDDRTSTCPARALLSGCIRPARLSKGP